MTGTTEYGVKLGLLYMVLTRTTEHGVNLGLMDTVLTRMVIFNTVSRITQA